MVNKVENKTKHKDIDGDMHALWNENGQSYI